MYYAEIAVFNIRTFENMANFVLKKHHGQSLNKKLSRQVLR